ENQLMKGSIEDRAEINLTYDINTPDGEKKVRELFYGSRHDEQQAELFERVFAMAQKLGVEVRHALRDSGENKEINKTVLGQYSLDKNSARVKHNGFIDPEQKGEVLLHELIHSVTSRAMFLKEQGHTDLLNNAQIQAIDEIEKIYKLVTEKAEELGVKGDYGLTNSHEMIAELANPVFRDKLKQIGVFDDTVAKITEVSTGVSHTETAYDRLNKALYQIMDNYELDFGEKWQQAKYSNIKMNDIFRQPEQPQEQTMKSSQEVLAEVMNKYETHIDSENGLMNKPLNQLSPQELEDRLTVAAARESRAIQYGYEPDDMQRLHNDLSKSFAEIIELSKQTDQESRSKLATSQEEMLNVLKVMQDAGMSLRYMPVAGLNNPVIENLITQAETFEQPKQQEQTMKTENSVPENTIKQDTFGLPENYQVRAADFDDFNPNLDGKTITANTLYSDIYTDIKPEQQGKTVGEVLRSDENALWDAEFWGELVGHGTVKVSDDLVAQVIETQRSEVLEEITTCGNVPFTKEHIEALYER
ncbi:MAG: hypothetical protein IKG79_04230, partial [Neisseriaceae bacterium]|nr:hypothetical protein [Neisseriaceae bacterium]